MRIRDLMRTDVVTVGPDTLVLDAEVLMKEKHVRRLPVVEDGRLVGIVTKYDLLEASPSLATSLSIFELNHLLAKLTVREIMTEDPVTVTPDMPFEEALTIAEEQKISSFPVVEDGKLVGITTESDVVHFMASALGMYEHGLRITIEGLGDRVGRLEQLIACATRPGCMILSLFLVPRPEREDWMAVLRLEADDPDAVVQEFKKAGFDVSHVVANFAEDR